MDGEGRIMQEQLSRVTQDAVTEGTFVARHNEDFMPSMANLHKCSRHKKGILSRMPLSDTQFGKA